LKNHTNGIINELNAVEFEANSTASKTIRIKSNNLVGHLVVGVVSNDIHM
jgi:hypothetical protein